MDFFGVDLVVYVIGLVFVFELCFGYFWFEYVGIGCEQNVVDEQQEQQGEVKCYGVNGCGFGWWFGMQEYSGNNGKMLDENSSLVD